jgi:hypothetical protein
MMNLSKVAMLSTFLTACGALPELAKTADDIFDDAVVVKVDKASIHPDTDLQVQVYLQNKDNPSGPTGRDVSKPNTSPNGPSAPQQNK